MFEAERCELERPTDDDEMKKLPIRRNDGRFGSEKTCKWARTRSEKWTRIKILAFPIVAAFGAGGRKKKEFKFKASIVLAFVNRRTALIKLLVDKLGVR